MAMVYVSAYKCEEVKSWLERTNISKMVGYGPVNLRARLMLSRIKFSGMNITSFDH